MTCSAVQLPVSSVCVDVDVLYPSSLTEKYLVGKFLAESALSVLKACTDRQVNHSV